MPLYYTAFYDRNSNYNWSGWSNRVAYHLEDDQDQHTKQAARAIGESIIPGILAEFDRKEYPIYQLLPESLKEQLHGLANMFPAEIEFVASAGN